jgi:hypothetical protein
LPETLDSPETKAMHRNRFQLALHTSRLAVLAVLVAGLAGCQGIAGIQPVSQVRVIDVSPDSPALDIYQSSPQSSAAELYNVGFGAVSSYLPVAAGAFTHAAYNAGTQQQLAVVHGTFAVGSQYTILVGNTAASLQMTVLKDHAYPAPAGQVAVRFLDQATHAGTVDVYLVPPRTSLSHVSPIDTGLSFTSNTGYIDAPSGSYSIVVVPAGTIPTSSTAPLYTGSRTSYASGSAHTIILIDQQPPGSAGLQVITATDYDSASN